MFFSVHSRKLFSVRRADYRQGEEHVFSNNLAKKKGFKRK